LFYNGTLSQKERGKVLLYITLPEVGCVPPVAEDSAAVMLLRLSFPASGLLLAFLGVLLLAS
jgi:hypothetical protein